MEAIENEAEEKEAEMNLKEQGTSPSRIKKVWKEKSWKLKLQD